MVKKILVIGTGSIAIRHIKNILNINPNFKIYVYSKNLNRAKKIVTKFKNKILIAKKLEKNDNYTHVVIASNTSKHNEYLNLFINSKNNIYCEKPLPDDKFFNFLKKKSLTKSINNKIKIGYQFRFNPTINFLIKELKKKENRKIYLAKFFCGQNLKDWRKYKSYKKFYSAGKKYFASVFWELSHEIDLLNYIFGKPKTVYSDHKKTQINKLGVCDISNTIFSYDNKMVCTLSLEMISPILYRKLIILTKSNYFEIDLIKNTIIKKNKKKKLMNYRFESKRNNMFLKFMHKFIYQKKYSNNFNFSRLQDGLRVTEIIRGMIRSNYLKKEIKA